MNIYIYSFEFEFEKLGKIILRYDFTPLFFVLVFLFANLLSLIIFINIDGYDNKLIYIFNQSRRALSQHQFGTSFVF